jgi:tRNA-binding EMAP/Myf-like protein
LDLRVGKIIKCEEHPTAKNLYVEQIDIGNSEIKSVCSGLVKHLKLEQVMFYFKNII